MRRRCISMKAGSMLGACLTIVGCGATPTTPAGRPGERRRRGNKDDSGEAEPGDSTVLFLHAAASVATAAAVFPGARASRPPRNERAGGTPALRRALRGRPLGQGDAVAALVVAHLIHEGADQGQAAAADAADV